MVAFSANNISFFKHRNLFGLRIEGLLLRARFVVYQILLVSLNQFPLAVASIIAILEIAHIGTYIYYSIRYKYAKNWLLFLSKCNINISIIIICLISIYISLTNWSARDYGYNVNKNI